MMFTMFITNNCNKYIAQHQTNTDNQTNKLFQLEEYNMRNIFFEKSYTHCGDEAIPRPFSKNPNLRIFLLYVKSRAFEIYWN